MAIRKVDDTDAEICLNLWYYVLQTGVVIRIAGKAYALKGTEQEKLAALKAVSATDHLTATMDRVPMHLVINEGARRLEGAMDVRSLPAMVSMVFGPLFNKLEASLPPVLRVVDEEYFEQALKIPDEPLFVLTAVYEEEDGRLTAHMK